MTPNLDDPNPNALHARAIVEELAHAGVLLACVAPGSRSTPLAHAFANHPNIHVRTHIDERSASFFALGAARASSRPVALLCSSGSAGAHFLPAVLEAFHDHIPLILLTADRPPELLHSGAGQTTNQTRFYDAHLRGQLLLSPPHTTSLSLQHLRTQLSSLLSFTRAPAPGPLHINAPFREPLAPSPHPIPKDLRDEATHGRPHTPFLSVFTPQRSLPPHALHCLRSSLSKARRPLIVCGTSPHANLPAHLITQLAESLQAPVLCDPISGLRSTQHPLFLTHCDLTLRSETFTSTHTPDLILRFGHTPTTKPYRLWRDRMPAGVREILVHPHGETHAPSQRATDLIPLHPSQLLQPLLASPIESHTLPQWTSDWTQAEHITSQHALHACTQTPQLWEGAIAHTLSQTLPNDHILWAASSMPIRDLDAFAPSLPRTFSNRGVNGIDGLIASALGAACTTGKHVTLLIGDVAFFHDASSLLTAQRTLSLTNTPLHLNIVVINNDGGGIFSYLPIAQHPQHFDELFTTPPNASPHRVAQGYGVESHLCTSLESLQLLLSKSLSSPPAVRLLEILVDRTHNVSTHKHVWTHTQTLLHNHFHTP